MAATDSVDVIVIGAGPVGLTLACELLRHGATVRLVEKRAEPNAHPNAAIVHVRTLEILDAMGAVDGFLREGLAFAGMHVRAFGKPIGFTRLDGVDSPYPAPRTLGQQVTEGLLREHLTRLGGRVEFDLEAVELEQDSHGVRVKLRKPGEKNKARVAEAHWVVGCEGSSSITRETLKIPFPGTRYHGKVFWQADTMVRWSYPHGVGYQFFGEQPLLFFAYKTPGHYRVICVQDDVDPENQEPPTLEQM